MIYDILFERVGESNCYSGSIADDRKEGIKRGGSLWLFIIFIVIL